MDISIFVKEKPKKIVQMFLQGKKDGEILFSLIDCIDKEIDKQIKR